MTSPTPDGDIVYATDELDGFTVAWHVPPPDTGQLHRVTRDAVSKDPNTGATFRHVYEWVPA